MARELLGQQHLPAVAAAMPISPDWDRTAEWPPKDSTPPPQQKAQLLGTRLGGAAKLMRAVLLYNKRLFADAQLGPAFRAVPTVVQNAKNVQLLKFAVGGPEAYCGADIGSVHLHLFALPSITRSQYLRLVEYLLQTLQDVKVQQDVLTDANMHLLPLSDKFLSGDSAVALPASSTSVSQPLAVVSTMQQPPSEVAKHCNQQAWPQEQQVLKPVSNALPEVSHFQFAPKIIPAGSSKSISNSSGMRRLSLDALCLKRNTSDCSFRSASLNRVLASLDNLPSAQQEKALCSACNIQAHAHVATKRAAAQSPAPVPQFPTMSSVTSVSDSPLPLMPAVVAAPAEGAGRLVAVSVASPIAAPEVATEGQSPFVNAAAPRRSRSALVKSFTLKKLLSRRCKAP